MPTATPTPTFAELGLPSPLINALARQEITTPFPIQSAAIPDVLTGRDVLGRGATGSGKTLAFGLPLLARLAGTRPEPRLPRAVILVPTRELALQVHDALAGLGQGLGLRARPIVGGLSMGKQVDGLRRGLDLVVATPGRLADHVRQGTCDLGAVEIAVLDEADQMADMGFLPQVRELLDLTPGGGQRLLFSATLDGDVDTLVRRYLTDPVTHALAPVTATISTMEHHLLKVRTADKLAVTTEIAGNGGRTMLFVRTKQGADRLVKQLDRGGVRAGALHGGKSQAARNRALGAFRDGSVPVLVATDVASRGVHVDGVDLVVHVDPPNDSKAYLHRAGRTARAGESGTVATLVMPHQERAVRALAKQAGIEPAWTPVGPGADALGAFVSPAPVPPPPPAKPASVPHRVGGDRPRKPRWQRTGRHPAQRTGSRFPHRPNRTATTDRAGR